MENLIQIPLYESPVKERNIIKYGELQYQCVCCGKPLKKDEKYKSVHMSVDWEAMHNSILDQKDAEIHGLISQGYFEIGNECAKKMNKNYLHMPD